MDSEVQRDGRILDLIDDAWREDKLPYEDVAIPLVSSWIINIFFPFILEHFLSFKKLSMKHLLIILFKPSQELTFPKPDKVPP